MAKKTKKLESVAILGLGPSLGQYLEITKRLGARSKLCDETWGINAVGDVIRCDRIFHMDDVRIQEIRAKAAPESNIAAMLGWMRETDVPIVTSRPHESFPTTEAFPLEAVVNDSGFAYFNSTAAYAVAYAIFRKVKKILLFGCDFTYANAHDAEKGRACVEFWLGIAAARGIQLAIPKHSSLMDATESQASRFYGYDTLDIELSAGANGKTKVRTKAHDRLPTAEQIEQRYDHSKHPNPLLS